MAPTKHSMLGPSSSHRWLSCTPSAKLESKFPATTSKYAEEGTLAHAIVEERLERLIKGKSRGQTSARLKKKELYKPEMETYCDMYVDTVMGIYDELSKDTKPILLSECQVDFSEWVPEGWGTTDTTIIAFGTMYIFDFKYGKNVRVEAKDNTQLRLYALGAYAENSILYDIDKVRMYIVQPRVADGTTMEEMAISDLLKWADEYVKPRAEMAYRGEGETIEGDWCQFCRAKTVCKARGIKFLRTLEQTSNNPALMNEEELATLLPLAEFITGWADELKKYMLDQAINRGAEYPGYKLVEGRSRRVILNPRALAQKLVDAGFTDIYELKGITDLEAVCGAKEFAELAGGLVDKPAGTPTLVKLSDPRPAIGGPQNMFNDEEEETSNG